MQEQAVLMSVKPKFVDMILSGEKDVELRRRLPSFMPGTRLFLYSSSPSKAVMGLAFVEDIHFLPKAELWTNFGHRTGVDWPQFSSYLEGTSHACGIEIYRSRRFQNPISLDVLREYCQGFRPPQSYQFVRPQDPLAHILEVQTSQMDLELQTWCKCLQL
jgi:predicted transcriptional regulator